MGALALPVKRDLLDRPREFAGRLGHLTVEELKLADLPPDSYTSNVRGLVVGETPGPKNCCGVPLFPWSSGSAAGRLISMGGLTLGQYLGGLYRRNLCDTPGEYDDVDARMTAREIIGALFDESADLRVVLLGVKVAEAFRAAGNLVPFEFFKSRRLESRQRCVVLPHPSGLNRLYNDSCTRDRARSWIRWAALGEEKPRNNP